MKLFPLSLNIHSRGNSMAIFIFLFVFQIIVQELDEPNQQQQQPQQQNSDLDSVTIFVRRWNPSEMKLGAFQEITINRKHLIFVFNLLQANFLFV